MWEERFASSPDFVFGKTPAQFLLDHDDYLTPGHTALSVADGEGRNSVHLAERGLNVTALEFAPTAIARARDLATERGVQVDFRQLDIMAQPWPTQQFDLVAGIFIQFVGPDGRRAQFRHMRDATKPGGLVMLHGYRPKQLDYGTGGPKLRDHLYTPDLLEKAFADLSEITVESYDAELDEGPGHSGMSALVDLIGTK